MLQKSRLYSCHWHKCCNFESRSAKGPANIISWLLLLVSGYLRTNVVRKNTVRTKAIINVARKKCHLRNWHWHKCCNFKSRSAKGQANIISWLLSSVSGYLRTNAVKRNTLGTNVRINVAKKCCLSNCHWHKCCNFKSRSVKGLANIISWLLSSVSDYVRKNFVRKNTVRIKSYNKCC